MVYIPRVIARAVETANATQSVVAPPTARAVDALDYSIPAGWDKPSVPTDYATLQRRTQNAYIGMKDFWPDANVFCLDWSCGTTLGAFAYKDMVASTKDNYDYVKTALSHVHSKSAPFDPYSYNDDAMWWGTTAIYAYRAYGKEQQFLDWAKTVWDWVQPSQITAAQAAGGSSPIRKSGFQKTCRGSSTQGGVFWRSQSSDRTDMQVNTITTSLFMTMSAYLAEITGEQKYIDAGKAAYAFMNNMLFMGKPNIPGDTINMNDCSIAYPILTYNAGKFIEGSYILARLTGDDAMKAKALKTVVEAVKNTPNWQTPQGLITEGQSGDPTKGGTLRQFKAIFLRALTEVERRENTNGPLRALLKAYVNVQWNAIARKAFGDNNKYGVVWAGPYVKSESGQMNVLDALNAALEMNWAR